MLDRGKPQQPELLKGRLPRPAEIDALAFRNIGNRSFIIAIDDLLV
jgi:hypothetical protein